MAQQRLMRREIAAYVAKAEQFVAAVKGIVSDTTPGSPR
jgi:hypothetical protein